MFVTAKPTGAAPKSQRDGWGSARALKPEWFVRPTSVGERTQEIAAPLFGEIESGGNSGSERRRLMSSVRR